jgi:hypothetical protein
LKPSASAIRSISAWVARHRSNGVAGAALARLEIQRARRLDRAQQISAVVGEVLLRALVEPAKRQEIGRVPGRAAAAAVLDIDREREQRRRPHGDHAEAERHARMGVADCRGGAEDFDLDRHSRWPDQALC